MDASISLLTNPLVAGMLSIAGAAALVRGIRVGSAAGAPGSTGLLRAMLLARGLRWVIAGLCAIAVVAGAAAGSTSTVGVALVILGEEMLEITTIVAALRWGEEQELRSRAGSSRSG
jgi:hypothetical protein